MQNYSFSMSSMQIRDALVDVVVVVAQDWFSLTRKHNISIASKNTHDISVSISRNIRRTIPLNCLMLFSLAHKHKRISISISISARKTNILVFLVLMLMLMRE